MKNLFRFSTEEKISISIKSIVIAIFLLGLASCGSIKLGFNSQPIVVDNTTQSPPVKVYTTNFETFKNLDPEDLGLNSTGNWVHCRTHGFHDLNDWTDFSYSPRFCRPSQGFTQAAQWNWNWGGWNHWNNNWMWNPRYRFDYFGNNWSPWMGNAHYVNYGYYGYNNWNYVPYRWRRSNINGRRSNSFRTRTSTRSTRPVRVIRSTRTVVPANTRPRTIRSSKDRIIKPRRTQTVIPPVRTNTRPVRTRRTQTVIPPVRTNTRPVRTRRTQTVIPPVRTNTRPVRTRRTQTVIPPVRTNTRPVRTRRTQTVIPPVRTNTRPVRTKSYRNL